MCSHPPVFPILTSWCGVGSGGVGGVGWGEEKVLINAATTKGMVSLAAATECNQLCSFLQNGCEHIFSEKKCLLELELCFHNKEVK